MPDTSKVEVLFYKASSGAIFCLQGVGATLQIRFGDLLCIRLTCMAIAKLITFSVNASDSVYFSRRTDPVKRGMDDQLYHAFTFDPSKSLLQRYKLFLNNQRKVHEYLVMSIIFCNFAIVIKITIASEGYGSAKLEQAQICTHLALHL